jgi:hypothetical protein
MRLAGHVARIGEMRNVYKILVGELKGRYYSRRHRHRWQENIKVGK